MTDAVRKWLLRKAKEDLVDIKLVVRDAKGSVAHYQEWHDKPGESGSDIWTIWTEDLAVAKRDLVSAKREQAATQAAVNDLRAK